MQNGANPAAQSYEDKVTPVDVAEQYQCSDILECLHCLYWNYYFFIFLY